MAKEKERHTYREELEIQLLELDQRADAIGLETVRQKIAIALDDLNEPAGKENARMVIQEVFKAFSTRRIRHTSPSSLPPSAAPFDEVTA